MPLDPSNLVGLWFCPGGGFNAWALILRPDGVGRAEMYNVGLTNAWVFDWCVEGERLRVIGREAIQTNEAQDALEHRPWELDLVMTVQFGQESLEGGLRLRTLRRDDELLDCFPKEYSTNDRTVDLFRPPDFSWILGLTRGN